MRKIIFLILISVLFKANCSVNAQNPIVTSIRTADPSAHVWADGKMWLYTSHDVTNNYNDMDGYHAFSSSDLITWKDYGEILHSRDLSWGVSGFMWAPTAAYRNGKYYLIYPHSPDGSREMKCGVAVSDFPQGPFKDLGWIEGVTPSKWLDPCVFEDVDGSYYLYWGVDVAYVAKLKENMTELAEEPKVIDYGAKNFFEASYMHIKDGKYYFSYNAKNAGGDYSIGESPYGPFEYKGNLLINVVQDHHSIVEFKNQWYLFYHWQNWKDGGKTQRNVAAEYLFYNADGTIKPISPTDQGIQIRK